jgi:hypothetical protein
MNASSAQAGGKNPCGLDLRTPRPDRYRGRLRLHCRGCRRVRRNHCRRAVKDWRQSAVYAAGRMSAGKRRPRLTLSRNDNNILRPGHPAFRHSHQTAAASTRQAPKGSGTRNMPHAASAIGDSMLRKFVMSSGALASGQGRNLNKVLTTGARNDWLMVNAGLHGNGVPFAPDAPESAARRSADWRQQVGNFDATFGLCQRWGPVLTKGLQTWRRRRPTAEGPLP